MRSSRVEYMVSFSAAHQAKHLGIPKQKRPWDLVTFISSIGTYQVELHGINEIERTASMENPLHGESLTLSTPSTRLELSVDFCHIACLILFQKTQYTELR